MKTAEEPAQTSAGDPLDVSMIIRAVTARRDKGKVWRHAHVQEFTADDLVWLAKKAGFRVEEDKSFLLGMIRAVRVVPV